MAAAPSRSTSTRFTPETGIALVFGVVTGTKFSVWVPGCRTDRRPFSSIRVLPVPRLRRLSEATSPRASFRFPVVRASWNWTSPAWGIDRNSSSPETAPVAMISFSVTTVTGREVSTFAPLIWLPMTVMASTSVLPELAPWAKAGAAARDTPASRANLKVVIILWDMPGNPLCARNQAFRPDSHLFAEHLGCLVAAGQYQNTPMPGKGAAGPRGSGGAVGGQRITPDTRSP